MLVHVTRFTAVQKAVHTQVEEYVRHIRQRLTRGIDDADLRQGLQDLWENDFIPTTRKIAASDPECGFRQNRPPIPI